VGFRGVHSWAGISPRSRVVRRKMPSCPALSSRDSRPCNENFTERQAAYAVTPTRTTGPCARGAPRRILHVRAVAQQQCRLHMRGWRRVARTIARARDDACATAHTDQMRHDAERIRRPVSTSAAKPVAASATGSARPGRRHPSDCASCGDTTRCHMNARSLLRAGSWPTGTYVSPDRPATCRAATAAPTNTTHGLTFDLSSSFGYSWISGSGFPGEACDQWPPICNAHRWGVALSHVEGRGGDGRRDRPTCIVCQVSASPPRFVSE
jgi:hypothetical protein